MPSLIPNLSSAGARIEKVFDKNGKVIGQRIVNNSTPISPPAQTQNGQILTVKAGNDGNRMPKNTAKVANLNSPQMAHQIVNGPNGQMFLVPANNNPKVHKEYKK